MSGQARPVPARVLAGAGAVAILGFAVVHRAPLALVLAVIAALSLRIEGPRMGALVARAIQWVNLAALAATGLGAFYARALGLLDDDASLMFARVLGYLLAALVAVMTLTPTSFTPRHVAPATLALLVVVGFQPSRVALAFIVADCMVLWTWAAVAGGPRRYWAAIAMLAAVGLPLAMGVVWLLPWAQPLVEATTATAFLDTPFTGLSETTMLGSTGSLSQSNRILLRAWSTEPHYLRAWVYRSFDGRSWSRALASPTLLPAPGNVSSHDVAGVGGRTMLVSPYESADATSPLLAPTRILLADSGDLPLLLPPRAVVLRSPELHASGKPAAPPPSLYGVLSQSRAFDGSPLSNLPTPADLELPSLDPRIAALARRLDPTPADPSRRVASVVHYLHTSLRYTLSPGRFRSPDPLAEFLFDKREGYCEYFATAAAVLLRFQGVPTRLVKGVTLGPHNRVADHYVVRERHAHAWIDAWIPDRGWVEVDPTPPADYARLHPPEASSLAAGLESLRSRLALLAARVREWDAQAVGRALAALADRLERRLVDDVRISGSLALIVVALLGLAVRRRWRGRAHQRTDGLVPPMLERMQRRVDRHLARRGRPRPGHRGLFEHLDSLPQDFLPGEHLALLRRVAEAYYRALFAGSPPPRETLVELTDSLERMLG